MRIQNQRFHILIAGCRSTVLTDRAAHRVQAPVAAGVSVASLAILHAHNMRRYAMHFASTGGSIRNPNGLAMRLALCFAGASATTDVRPGGLSRRVNQGRA